MPRGGEFDSGSLENVKFPWARVYYFSAGEGNIPLIVFRDKYGEELAYLGNPIMKKESLLFIIVEYASLN